MLKNLILNSSLFLTSSFLSAELMEINQIDAIRPYITENALCLFDIDDTLIDNPTFLGSSPWRNWIKSKTAHFSTNFVLYDALTLFIAKNGPYKTVEPSTSALITDLQNQGQTVFAFTARGRSQWYTTHIEGVDRFTHEQLRYAGIDFKKTVIPQALQALDPTYFYEGIIFAKHIQKGDLFKQLFKDLNYTPSLILFVDDKLDQVQSVEAAVKEVGIPFIGFWYRRSELDRNNFNPKVTNIQLESLLLTGEIMCDETALELANINPNDDHQAYFNNILHGNDLNNLLQPAL